MFFEYISFRQYKIIQRSSYLKEWTHTNILTVIVSICYINQHVSICVLYCFLLSSSGTTSNAQTIVSHSSFLLQKISNHGHFDIPFKCFLVDISTRHFLMLPSMPRKNKSLHGKKNFCRRSKNTNSNKFLHTPDLQLNNHIPKFV